jgi:hypothetical protein
LVPREHKELEAHRVPLQARELKGLREHKEDVDPKVCKAPRVPPVAREFKGQGVHKELLEVEDFQVQLVPQEIMVLWEHKVPLELEVPKGYKVQGVLREQGDQRAQRAYPE